MRKKNKIISSADTDIIGGNDENFRLYIKREPTKNCVFRWLLVL